MTPRRGPRRIGSLAALAGLLTAGLAVAALVAGLQWLAAPAERLAGLERPAEPDRDAIAPPEECPELTRANPPVEVSASALIACPRSFHRRTVTYRGEAVRAVLTRDDWAWLHVNDDPYARRAGPIAAHRTAMGGNSGVPVRIPREHAERIDVTGDAHHRGVIVAVTGTWLVDGAADGGGPAIRAHDVEVVEPGRRLRQPTDPARAWTAGLLAVAAAGLTAWTGLRRRWRRRLPSSPP